jgi:flagellar protein FliO/FliZ
VTPPGLLGVARRAGLWPAAGALLVAVAVPVDGTAGMALRALAVLGGLVLAAAAVRRAPAAPRPLAVLDRQGLGRDAGLALVEVSGRTLLIGFAARGVELVADLTPDARGAGR